MGITAIWFRGRMNPSDDIRGGSSNAPNQATSAALVSRSGESRPVALPRPAGRDAHDPRVGTLALASER
jgi:hypothetical protein